MYIVTKNGHKLPVDASSIPEDEFRSFHETVGLYDDCTTLKDIWILSLQRWAKYDSDRAEMLSDYKFVAEIKFTHEPSQEEILFAMSQHGLSRYDIANVEKWLELDMGEG
jgi:hypothetical protein